MRLIECSVPTGTQMSDFDLFPGSDHANMQGCLCPTKQKLWPQKLVFAADCPVHQLEKLNASSG
jgi:hypothetical protein